MKSGQTRHLYVIGKSCNSFGVEYISADAAVAIAIDVSVFRLKLHDVTERIAYRSTNHASTIFVNVAHRTYYYIPSWDISMAVLIFAATDFTISNVVEPTVLEIVDLVFSQTVSLLTVSRKSLPSQVSEDTEQK